MKEYRVTIDTASEGYCYHVMAKNKADAEEEGLALAADDGMGQYDTRYITVESL